MFPIKEWLSTSEACSFLSIGETAFSQFVIDNKLTISSPFKSRKYYKVSEINKALENNIIVKGAIKL